MDQAIGYQIFSDNPDPTVGAPRVALLREALGRHGLDGFVVPRSDEHQGEYVPPHAERLKWLTGFGGSAGMAIVLKDRAAIFIDGRYTLQVRDPVDMPIFDARHPVEEPAPRWIEENLTHGARLGFDPWLHTAAAADRLRAACKKAGAELVPCPDNLIDEIWDDQPSVPFGRIVPHPLEHAGEDHESKLVRVSDILEHADVHAAVLTQPDSIAWLFNIRGSDVSHTPLPLSFAILHEDGHADLFVDDRKLTNETRAHLGNKVTLHAPGRLKEALDELGAGGKEIRLDPASAADWIRQRLADAGAVIKSGDDPCVLPKARKNEAEIEGSAAAHLRDGAAICELLAWLDAQAPGTVSEIDVVERLEELRRRDPALRDVSFDTIAGTGPNGAIMHYRVTHETNATLQDGDLLVLDSGGQYLDGTTDITRTIAIGTPGDEERTAWTRVLQGMIAMSELRWPRGLAGRDIEAVARMPLWLAGQDFNHGVGHGVGAYLSVHEGPQRLSRTSHIPLEPGMILSNEPGYYREGAFGIRLENLLVVQPAPKIGTGDPERDMLSWRTLTFAPVDRRLIVLEMLTASERTWINRYHSDVAEKIGPRLGKEAKLWLDAATAPL